MSSEERGIAIREGEGGCRERLVSQREVCYSLQGCASDVNTPPNEAVGRRWEKEGRGEEGRRRREREEGEMGLEKQREEGMGRSLRQ